jgi:hypothetical protein
MYAEIWIDLQIVSIIVWFLNEIGVCQQIFVKLSDTKFHENLFRSSRAVTLDRYSEATSCHECTKIQTENIIYSGLAIRHVTFCCALYLI